jgi:5-methyltetrahydropteroyltriglutamate--homocysteine methyltransferase
MTTRPQGRPPFRADHIGSLLRPAALRQAFRRHTEREIGDEEFARIQDDCIRAVIRMQEEIGFEVVTDGEFRRGEEADFTAPYASAPVRRTHPLALDEYAFLHQASGVAAKITLPAPSTMHFFRFSDFADPAVYGDAQSFFADLIAVYRDEMADLVRAGCRYVQLDEVAIALLCDPAIRSKMESAASDPDALVDVYIDAINETISACPADVVVGVHMCRGNFRSRYLGEGGYESVAERFFTRTRANHFLLEYDTPRAGDFAPLRFVSSGKGIVLGLISSKTPSLEGIDALRRRVEEATKHIALDQLAISPQCGFASTAAGNPLTEADQQAKLRLVVAAARAIWN